VRGKGCSFRSLIATVPHKSRKCCKERHRVPRLTRIWFDGGFSGADFLHWVMDICHWIVDVVLRPNGSKGFVLLPKRWTVVGVRVASAFAEACRRHTDLWLVALVMSP
jgi:transposase